MNVAQVDYGLIAGVEDPDELLDMFPSLTGWSEALLAAGVSRVSVAQRFAREGRIVRRGVEYVFCRSISQLHDAVRSFAPDIAHVNGLRFPLETWLLRRALPSSAAIVVQDHAAGDPSPRIARRSLSFRRQVWRRGLGAADAFLFTASAQADAWKAAGLVRRDQRVFDVVESSTDLAPIPRSEARAESGVRGDPALLWVGRLNANKDPLTVLAGFERAAEALPGAVMTMVYGADDLLPHVRSRIESSDRLRSRVILAGLVPHAAIGAFFSAADAFVLGSHHEGSGYALLEACACGVVPAVANIPSFRAITGGVIGALWRVGDAEDCRRAILESVSGDRVAKRARVQQRFRTDLSWDAVGRAAIRAYGELLTARRTHEPT